MLITKNQISKVALEQMNQVHFEAIDLINDIYSSVCACQELSKDKKEISAKLDRFLLHTQAHFANEEKLMQESGFFAYTCHKEAHDMALERLEDLLSSFKRDSDLNQLKFYFEIELIEWLDLHIETMDTVTANFISQNVSGLNV